MFLYFARSKIIVHKLRLIKQGTDAFLIFKEIDGITKMVFTPTKNPLIPKTGREQSMKSIIDGNR